MKLLGWWRSGVGKNQYDAANRLVQVKNDIDVSNMSGNDGAPKD